MARDDFGTVRKARARGAFRNFREGLRRLLEILRPCFRRILSRLGGSDMTERDAIEVICEGGRHTILVLKARGTDYTEISFSTDL
ncbi:hypothetical protein [Rhodomicrobium lacus]|uniref:hypothetical protein n=1 Tax=Rhodomicrobium lacus TaxID=2498452 RepID=UPI0026E2CCD4|nr:hypothetical protein [Rhodomicrobium lacus]WKW50633.1 hypothetical protein QMO75_15380 [Rhodomicrobium lacus]